MPGSFRSATRPFQAGLSSSRQWGLLEHVAEIAHRVHVEVRDPADHELRLGLAAVRLVRRLVPPLHELLVVRRAFPGERQPGALAEAAGRALRVDVVHAERGIALPEGTRLVAGDDPALAEERVVVLPRSQLRAVDGLQVAGRPDREHLVVVEAADVEAVRRRDRLLHLGARAQELDVELDPEVLLRLRLSTGRPLDTEADHVQRAGVLAARPCASGLRSRRAGECAAGRQCRRAEASLDEQVTPRHAPSPRLRTLGPDDVRIRVVPAPEFVAVPQLIRVLLGIEPEIFEVTHATSPFSSRREAVWLRPAAAVRVDSGPRLSADALRSTQREPAASRAIR